MRRYKIRNQSEIVLTELAKKSKNGLEFAKRTILSKKVQSRKLREALEYYVSYWNDVTHPGLFAVAYEAVCGDLQVAVPIQAAVAMIAAAFDIHDDIVDKSTMKHGILTVFGKFGAEMALLLGDAFLIEGFALFAESIRKLDQDRTNVLEIIKQSLYEFGNAHALELGLRKEADVPPEEYMKIVRMKAASIEGDMRIGAIVGGGTEKEVEILAEYGRILGTLAILREEFIDIFDIKELSQRMTSEYLPVPVLYAMQDEESRKKIEILIANKITEKNLGALVDAVLNAENVVKLEKHMEELVAEAVRLTSIIQNRNLTEILRIFVSSTLEDL